MRLVIVLAVHSSTPVLGAAVVRDGRVVCERSLPPGRKHVENIAGLIDDIMREGQVSLARADAFAVTTGPGSFSGIRVGLAVVKGLALALGTPVIGISCLEALAWESLGEGQLGMPMIDARREEVYTALYQKKGTRAILTAGPFLMAVDDLNAFAREISGSLVLSGDRLGEELACLGPHILRSPVATVSAKTCALIALTRLETGETDDVHGLAPLYIRRSDAEEKKVAR